MELVTEKDIADFLERRGYVCTGKSTDNTDLFSKQISNIKLVCRRNKQDTSFYSIYAMDLRLESRSERILACFDVYFSIQTVLMYKSFDKSEDKLIKMVKAFYDE